MYVPDRGAVCVYVRVQVLNNVSYAQSAAAISDALQRYAAQRHPYERAADEIELAIRAADIHAASSPIKPTEQTDSRGALPDVDKAGRSNAQSHIDVAGMAEVGVQQRTQGAVGTQDEL
jgi:hypothetical protein